LLAVGHDEVFAAAIAGCALVIVAIIQNGVGHRRGAREREQLRSVSTAAASEAANGAAHAAREEMRSAVRDIVEELAKVNLKLDAILQVEDEHGNGHLEDGGKG